MGNWNCKNDSLNFTDESEEHESFKLNMGVFWSLYLNGNFIKNAYFFPRASM